MKLLRFFLFSFFILWGPPTLLYAEHPLVQATEQSGVKVAEPTTTIFSTFSEYSGAQTNLKTAQHKLNLLELELNAWPEERKKIDQQTIDQKTKLRGFYETDEFKNLPSDKKQAKRDEIEKKIKEIDDKYFITIEKKKTLPLEVQKTKDEIKKLSVEVEKTKRKFFAVAFITFKKFLIFLGILLILLVLRSLIHRIVTRKIHDYHKAYLIRHFLNISTISITILIVLALLVENISYLITIIGFISAGVAIALQDVFTSFVGWLILVGAKGIKVGDRIQTGEVVGEVIEIGVLRTTLIEIGSWLKTEQETGRGILLTNNFIFKNPIFNYNFAHDYVWQKVDITLTFESNWKKAQRLLKEVLVNNTGEFCEKANRYNTYLSRLYNMEEKKNEPALFMNIADSGVQFTLRFMVPTHQILSVKNMLSEKIMELIQSEPDLELAYPTQRINLQNQQCPQ
ncbi:MAG: mechanosensitive ion channel [Deltaproteobacteria bacterium]|nr:mechanosensitive ion channel [Deltaproteobacteria bacterium]